MLTKEKEDGRTDDGKISQVEDTSPLDDDYDVNIRLAGSGVVYDVTRPYNTTVRIGQRCNWCNDWCVCRLDGA